MSKYKHILAAIDITEDADGVLVKAKQTAEDNDAHLSLVTVIRPLTYAYTGMEVAGLAAAALNFESEARSSVDKSLNDLCDAHKVDAHQRHVAFGVPANEIKTLAGELGVDLIVMGSHGRHGIGLLLGSTANAVLHGASCDVLTVRIQDK